MKEYSNRLIHESSPYLLQHAHNPVDWFPWGDEALAKAKNENKLIIISIGYSACHWCHVMEHESFENNETADIMNKYFICIKVDREERPDIDQVYMQAVQMMTGQGGWPLNCFALPDGKPVYGGTYFPRIKWNELLLNLAEAYKKDNKEFIEYGDKLLSGMISLEGASSNNYLTSIDLDLLKRMLKNWIVSFNSENGGNNRAPKFPMPHNYLFLLRYGFLNNDQSVINHVTKTLNMMAYGGIYDQIRGGFARYSTDMEWKVPHFEKMLYDNAQLVSLYSEAYLACKEDLYKQVVFETLEWVEQEMTSKEGAFYSAIDADSEGEEGKFYTWKLEELKEILGSDFDFAKKIFCIDERGYWESGQYILIREKDIDTIKSSNVLDDEGIKNKVLVIKKKLLLERNKRKHPEKDDKILTSWNAMMAKGYIDSYKVFKNENHLSIALKNIDFILKNLKNEKNQLLHCYKNGKATINGFLEDYCFLADALIAAYSVTFNEKWLNEAVNLIDYVHLNFYNPNLCNFYFTDRNFHHLITRPIELDDNVIPSTNSVMASILFILGYILGKSEYIELSKKMILKVANEIEKYPSAYSNWALLYLNLSNRFYQVIFSGKKAKEIQNEFFNYYFPNLFTIGCQKESNVAILSNRFDNENSFIFVCENQTCHLPVQTVKDAIKLINDKNFD